MLTFGNERSWFTYRVAAIALHNNHVLLHRAEQDSFWSLPGGRCEFSETSSDALKRELVEEINAQVEIGRLVWVVENFFDLHNKAYHEINFCYLVTLPAAYLDTSQPFDGLEPQYRLIYQWFSLETLPSLRVYPSFLKTALQNLPETTTHLIHVDDE